MAELRMTADAENAPAQAGGAKRTVAATEKDRKSTRLNSSHP